MSINELAKLMNVTEADVAGFISCLRLWMDKGLTLEQAIEKHMSQMRRLVNNAIELADKMSKNEEFVGELYADLRAVA